MIKKQDKVSGTDLYGKEIKEGVVVNIMSTFGVAQVKYGQDRLDITTMSLDSLTEAK
jgi:hypothetical protein